MANRIPHKFVTQARVTGGHTLEEVRKLPEFDADALLAKAKERAFQPAIFDTRAPFFWRDQISSDVIDSYFTRMHESTLKNFASDATAGISFQYNHDWSRSGLGWSLFGHFEKLSKPTNTDGTEPSMRTVTDFYTIPGLKMNSDMGTDDFIAGVQAGLLQDVSVGFFAGSIKCGICGGDMYNGWFGIWGRNCNHFPGKYYDDPYVDEKGNAYGGRVLATAWILDGTLSETSQVFDGACPGAGHLKAMLWADNNLLDGRGIRELEQHYRMKLPGGASLLQVPELSEILKDQGVLEAMRTAKVKADAKDESKVVVADEAKDEATRLAEVAARKKLAATPDPDPTKDEDDDDESEDERSMLADLQAKFTANGITLATTARATIEQLCELVITQRGTIKDLTSEAEDGRKYRKDLIDEALKMGASALGSEKWDEAKYGKILNALDIEGVIAMRDTWEETRNIKFPDQRVTRDEMVLVSKNGSKKSERDDRDFESS